MEIEDSLDELLVNRNTHALFGKLVKAPEFISKSTFHSNANISSSPDQASNLNCGAVLLRWDVKHEILIFFKKLKTKMNALHSLHLSVCLSMSPWFHQWPSTAISCRGFSRDVTAAMFVFLNKGIATMLVILTNPLGIEIYYHAKIFFSFGGKTRLLIP